MIKYPKKLVDGDYIGLTALSGESNLKKIDIAINNLKDLGFNIEETSNVRKKQKYLVSSKASERAEEFIKLYQDKKIKHIISTRGGELLIDIIPYIHEYKEFFNNLEDVKYVQGYSDNSLLNFYLTTNYNISTINSININDFWMKELTRPQADVINIIKGNYENNEYVQESFEKYEKSEYDEGNYLGYNLTEKVEYKLLDMDVNNLKVEGRIIGGCIDTITQLLGTKFDNTNNYCRQFNEGVIWYIDIAELSSVELYRRLIQMKNSNWFINVKLFLIGRKITDITIEDFDYEVALRNSLNDLNVPVIYDVDIGHTNPQLVIMNGTYGIFEYNTGRGKLVQKFT